MTAREQHIAVAKSARYYTVGDSDTARDVWIVCHGYGQLAGRFIGSFECIATESRSIVAPEGLHRFYLDPPPAPAKQRRVGATWMTREDRDTDITDNVAYLDRLAQHIVGNRSDVRLRALGFSQGAATVFRWAALGSTRIDELILWGGEVPPDVDMTAAALRLRDVRVAIVHGRSDRMAPEQQLQKHLQSLQAAGIAHQRFDFDGGHELNDAMLQLIAGET
jgi:predicted esterase